MIPREHGAYGQLLAPMMTALALGRPGIAAFALVAAAICAFLAHEPLLVMVGQRGARAAREREAEAKRWLAIFSVPAFAFGAVAVAMLDSTARLALILPLIGVAVLAGLIVGEREHTAGGEVVSAIVLATIASPVALAAGAVPAVALTCATVFAAGFVAATMCVHGVIARTRRPPAASVRILGATVAMFVVIAFVVASRIGMVSAVAPWAVLPMCIAGLVLVAVPPSARHLRVVGWMLVGSTVLTSAWLIAALR
jgi:YwiC-like protein